MSELVPFSPPPRSLSVSTVILIVNDDPDALFLMEHAFNRSFPEATVLTAIDGQEALAIWERQAVSAIVTDNHMPRVSGLLLTQRIRQTDLRLPVIMVTTALEKSDDAVKAGVTLYCAEYIPEELVRAVKACLGVS